MISQGKIKGSFRFCDIHNNFQGFWRTLLRWDVWTQNYGHKEARTRSMPLSPPYFYVQVSLPSIEPYWSVEALDFFWAIQTSILERNICNYNTKDTCCKCGRISYSLRTGTGSANVGISLRQLSPVLHELPWQASTATYVSSVSGQTVSNNSYQFLKRNLLA